MSFCRMQTHSFRRIPQLDALKETCPKDGIRLPAHLPRTRSGRLCLLFFSLPILSITTRRTKKMTTRATARDILTQRYLLICDNLNMNLPDNSMLTEYPYTIPTFSDIHPMISYSQPIRTSVTLHTWIARYIVHGQRCIALLSRQSLQNLNTKCL